LRRTINCVTKLLPRAKPDGVSPLLKPEDGETPMTTETNSVLNSVKEAFAPVTEAFTKFQNLEVPEAARDFVKKQAETAKVRAADLHAGSEKVTAAVETAVAGSVAEAAKISRNIQQALYQDAEAFFAGIDKLASAKSLSEAAQIQSELVRARGEVFVSRAKASSEYLGKLVTEGAKNAQDNFSKVYSKTA
jgi:phasin